MSNKKTKQQRGQNVPMVVADDAPFIPVEAVVETEVPTEEVITESVTEVTKVPEVVTEAVEVKAEILSLLDKVLLKYRYKEAPDRKSVV